MNARAQAGNRAVVRSENLVESSNPRPFEGEGFCFYFCRNLGGGGNFIPRSNGPGQGWDACSLNSAWFMCHSYICTMLATYTVQCTGWRGGEQVVR